MTNSNLKLWHVTIFLVAIVLSAFFYKKVTSITRPTVSNLGPSNLINGSASIGTTPSFTFDVSDDGLSVRYEIQIDDSSDFSSPVIDFLSAANAVGSLFFRVGTAAGEGDTYIIGGAVSELSPGEYYWRVKAIDEDLQDSGYTSASEEEIAFVVLAEADETQPTIYSIDTSASSTSITVTWKTNEAANSIVAYGTKPLDGGGRESDISYDVDHTLIISNLLPCTVYYYIISSEDRSGNAKESEETEIFTDGCSASTTILEKTITSVSRDAGGVVTLDDGSYEVSLDIPTNFTSSDESINVQVKKLDKDIFVAEVNPPPGRFLIGENIYDFIAIETVNTSLSSFDELIPVTISYLDSDISGIHEESIAIFRFNDDSNDWTELSSCSVNTASNSVTCMTDQFSVYTIFGEQHSNRYGSYVVPTTPTVSTDAQKPAQDVNNPETIENLDKIKFLKDFGYLSIGGDVKKLQQYLNSHGFVLAESGYGSPGNETMFFGPLTRAALIKFQEANAEFILKPQGLSSGNGFFGPLSRGYVNTHP